VGGLAERKRVHRGARCLNRVTDELTRGCAAHDMDGEPAPTGARGKPANPMAAQAAVTIGSPRATSIMARSVSAPHERPEIRVQSELAAAFGVRNVFSRVWLARLNLRARSPGLPPVTKSPLTGCDRREVKPIIRVTIKGLELDWFATRHCAPPS
jgi:hypothetical protein